MAAPARTLEGAVERGELTDAQIRELIAREAKQLGLTFAEATARARAGTLPGNYLAADIELLVELLSD